MKVFIRRYSYLIFYLILVVFFLTFFSFTFKEDEEVTMGFMEHSLLNIVKIDSLDVHPPLYYLLLKIFLCLTTFWTKSIFIKIIFAKLFSFILFIIGIYFLIEILMISGVRIKYKYQILLYCFMPSILEVSTYLRMYELATLFIIIEYYSLLLFMYFDKNKYLIYSIICALMASYTQYFVAITSFIFLLTFIVKYKFNHKSITKLVASVIIYFVLYMPVVPYVLKQFLNRNKYPSVNTGIFDSTISSLVQLTSSGNHIKQLFDIILFFLFLFITIYFTILNKSLLSCRLYEIGFVLVNSIIIELILSFIYKPFFECRFIFPLFAIYSFIFVNILITYNGSTSKIIRYAIIFLTLLLIISDGQKMKQNIDQYDKPSITLISNLHKWKNHKSNYINVTNRDSPTLFGNALFATQNSVYLKSIHKNAIVYNYKGNNIYMECNHNRRFVHMLFKNLHIYN